MQMVRSSEVSSLSPADALGIDYYRSKQQWVEFKDDLLVEKVVVEFHPVLLAAVLVNHQVIGLPQRRDL